jgi:hypothetical protein
VIKPVIAAHRPQIMYTAILMRFTYMPDSSAARSLPPTRFNIAPFIATLGTLYVARGTAQLSNNGATFPNLVGNPELGNTGFKLLTGKEERPGINRMAWGVPPT